MPTKISSCKIFHLSNQIKPFYCYYSQGCLHRGGRPDGGEGRLGAEVGEEEDLRHLQMGPRAARRQAQDGELRDRPQQLRAHGEQTGGSRDALIRFIQSL